MNKLDNLSCDFQHWACIIAVLKRSRASVLLYITHTVPILRCLTQKVRRRNNNSWSGSNLILQKNVVLTVLSSWRSCWFKFVDSSKRASKAAIFSSFISRDFLSVDSNFDSKSLYLLVNDITYKKSLDFKKLFEVFKF